MSGVLGMEDESQLVRRSQQGDLDAFNLLVERYQGQVYNLALRLLGDQALAADASQEAFMSAYRGIKAFRGGNLRSWFLRIAANASKDMLRSAKARPAASLDALELVPSATPRSREESPEDSAVRQELGREIGQGMKTLPHDQRLALVLVDIQGFSYEEAAQTIGKPVGTVKSRLSRAREQMREYLRSRPELLPARFRLDE